MICPWCGGEMESGCLEAPSQNIYWLAKKRNLWWKGPRKEDLVVSDEDGFYPWKTAWYCLACQKMVLDTAGIQTEGAATAFQLSPKS